MKVLGVYIVSNNNEIVFSVQNETDALSSFFPIKKEDLFITSTELKDSLKDPKSTPYKHEQKYYYGIKDMTETIYYLVSDIKNNVRVKKILEEIKEINLTIKQQHEKSNAIKNLISKYATESTQTLPAHIIFRNLKNRLNTLCT